MVFHPARSFKENTLTGRDPSCKAWILYKASIAKLGLTAILFWFFCSSQGFFTLRSGLKDQLSHWKQRLLLLRRSPLAWVAACLIHRTTTGYHRCPRIPSGCTWKSVPRKIFGNAIDGVFLPRSWPRFPAALVFISIAKYALHAMPTSF